MMRTVCVGHATLRHQAMYAAAAEALAACEAAMRPGRTFGDVYDAHAAAVDAHGMAAHRLNACGYNLGAHFTPCWMDMPMFYRGNRAPIEAGMVLFAHMILMDSETGTAMNLGQTYEITNNGPACLSTASLDLPIRSG
jgi:Xaa-Pro dipeptidase